MSTGQGAILPGRRKGSWEPPPAQGSQAACTGFTLSSANRGPDPSAPAALLPWPSFPSQASTLPSAPSGLQRLLAQGQLRECRPQPPALQSWGVGGGSVPGITTGRNLPASANGLRSVSLWPLKGTGHTGIKPSSQDKVSLIQPPWA